MRKLLIIDDEPEMLKSLEKILSRREEYNLRLVENGEEALELVGKDKFDLIITDLKMKKISGIDILKKALSKFADAVVIMISGYGTIEASVEALNEGAFDFIEKPFTSKKLLDSIDRAFSQKYNEDTIDKKSVNSVEKKIGIIYKSRQMANVLDIVSKVANSNMNVLITGESGTGKELVARAIHGLSDRKHQPFVPVNCGALPEHLFESELFGHERGAFTGAVKTKPGLIEFANYGTFFFDEIGDMSLPLQVKLLRMLEEHKIRRVGGQKEIKIDVRIIAATNKNIKQTVSDGNFREDLYYRIQTIQIDIPPLRERKEDIMPLANQFLSELCLKNDKLVRRFSSDAEDLLKNYPWPGNVRELQNVVGRAYFLSSSKVIQTSNLPLPIPDHSITMNNKIINLNYKNAKESVLEKFEMEYLTYHLKQNEGNISKTAQKCDLDRRSIHRLINKYNIIYHED